MCKRTQERRLPRMCGTTDQHRMVTRKFLHEEICFFLSAHPCTNQVVQIKCDRGKFANVDSHMCATDIWRHDMKATAIGQSRIDKWAECVEPAPSGQQHCIKDSSKCVT